MSKFKKLVENVLHEIDSHLKPLTPEEKAELQKLKNEALANASLLRIKYAIRSKKNPNEYLLRAPDPQDPSQITTPDLVDWNAEFGDHMYGGPDPYDVESSVFPTKEMAKLVFNQYCQNYTEDLNAINKYEIVPVYGYYEYVHYFTTPQEAYEWYSKEINNYIYQIEGMDIDWIIDPGDKRFLEKFASLSSRADLLQN